MSTKTVTKRVALATVVALGAGVLSLVSVTSAHAAANNNLISNTTANPDASGYLNIAQLNSTTGVAVLPNAQNGGGIQVARSFGLVATDDLAGNAAKSAAPSAGVTGVATLLANGTLTVYESATPVVNKFQTIVVSGAKITAGYGNSYQLNGTQTAYIDSATLAAPVGAVTIQPNSGVTSFTVSFYDAVTTSTNAIADALGSPTSGTLTSYYVVTVAAAGTTGVVSQTKSAIYYMGNAGGYTVGNYAGLTGDTTTGTPGTSAWNVAQIANIRVRDSYGTPLTGGLLTVSATNGAYVAITANSGTPAVLGTPASTANSSSVPYLSGATAGDNDAITVLPSVSTASTTTVTVSYNGVVVGVKSFSFTGKVAQVVLSAPGNGNVTKNPDLSSGTGPNYGNIVTAKFLDSAGNQVYPSSANSSSYPPTTVTKDAATSGQGISYTAAYSYYPTAASSTQVYSCPSLNATGSFAIDYQNVDGSIVVSNTVPVSCSGTAYSYTAKLDKAKYAPGDIAILTVTFKDALGALASDQTNTITTAGNTTTALPQIYAGSALLLTGGYSTTTAGNNTDATTNGVKKYTFIAGNTSGSYALNVDFPVVDAASGQSSLQVPFTIADGSTSLNDVLKGIVSLIASINKQIAALAKLVTKK
jgi:hypothetical protein